MDDRHIILNRIETPDGTILTSYSVHDYKTYIDKNGCEYMVDGGCSYLRRNVNDDFPEKELSVYSDAPFDIIRKSMHWGTFGKDGNQPLKYVLLCDLSDSHIKEILNTQKRLPKWKLEIFEKELEYRILINKTIEE